jgi:hypothetical protein
MIAFLGAVMQAFSRLLGAELQGKKWYVKADECGRADGYGVFCDTADSGSFYLHLLSVSVVVAQTRAQFVPSQRSQVPTKPSRFSANRWSGDIVRGRGGLGPGPGAPWLGGCSYSAKYMASNVALAELIIGPTACSMLGNSASQASLVEAQHN